MEAFKVFFSDHILNAKQIKTIQTVKLIKHSNVIHMYEVSLTFEILLHKLVQEPKSLLHFRYFCSVAMELLNLYKAELWVDHLLNSSILVS